MKNFWAKFQITSFCCLTLIVASTLINVATAQNAEREADATFIRKIYDQSLTDGRCYPWLEHLSLRIGDRKSVV